MSFKRTRLNEGVFLNVYDTPKFKNNYLAISFAQPLDKETASMNALLPLILTRGTVSYPTMEKMSTALDSLYASTINTRCFKKGEVQFIGFNCGILSNSYATDDCDIFGGTLDILREVIFEPYTENGIFSEKYLETEKQNLCDRIAAQINNKTSYAIARANEEMCKDETYGISAMGDIASVESINAGDLYEHYKKVIANAHIEIFFVGEYGEAIDSKIRSVLNFEARTPAALKTDVVRSASSVKEITEEQSVNQAKLSIGFRTGKVLSDGDYYKFVLFNEVYGGSPTSKLFMNVREKLSLCYYCKSIPEPQKGVMIVTAGVEEQNKEKAQSEILAQLKDISEGNITDEEFESAVCSILNAYREIDDNPESIENWYLGRMLAGLTTSPAQTAEQIASCTKADIADMAKGITLDTVYFMKPEDNADE
ncbi:MAG: insulinase family protein [Clostridia bacterium]|nr:insulinase family protein [Clostridia bacterium]